MHEAPSTRTEIDIRHVGYDHPDVATLTEQVQQEYVQRYGGPDDSPMSAEMFTPPAGRFFIGYVDGVPVATGAWRHSGVEALGTSRTAEIKRMYVVPAAQRRGFARRMLAQVERSAAQAGYEAIVLETGNAQPEALALYESSGYVPIPPFGHYADEPDSRHYGKVLAVADGLSA